MNMDSMSVAADQLRKILELETEPVGVYLLSGTMAAEAPFETFKHLRSHRYCQALMRARRGDSVMLLPEDLACPAAARAFGFRPLPAGLASGKGLVGFGIVQDAEAGRRMFDEMPHLEDASIGAIAACPLHACPKEPDVVVVEGPPEALMWLTLADLNRTGGSRRRADTAVLQATCVDATVIPHLEQRMNFVLGCYGCREATDLGRHETVLGFPAFHLSDLVAGLEKLAERAIPRSREKSTFRALASKESMGDANA